MIAKSNHVARSTYCPNRRATEASMKMTSSRAASVTPRSAMIAKSNHVARSTYCPNRRATEASMKITMPS
jgi:hypothetical protein